MPFGKLQHILGSTVMIRQRGWNGRGNESGIALERQLRDAVDLHGLVKQAGARAIQIRNQQHQLVGCRKPPTQKLSHTKVTYPLSAFCCPSSFLSATSHSPPPAQTPPTPTGRRRCFVYPRNQSMYVLPVPAEPQYRCVCWRHIMRIKSKVCLGNYSNWCRIRRATRREINIVNCSNIVSLLQQVSGVYDEGSTLIYLVFQSTYCT